MGGDEEIKEKVPGQKKQRTKLKGWRLIAGGGHDYQFFDAEQLDLLEAKEEAWKQFNENPDGAETTPPPEFSELDAKLKQELMEEGHRTWNRKDFYYFIKMAETYGRSAIELYTEGLPNKSEHEIRVYANAFWENYKKIENYHKYIERIERGEFELKKKD